MLVISRSTYCTFGATARCARSARGSIAYAADATNARRSVPASPSPDLPCMQRGGVDARDALPHVLENGLAGKGERRAALRAHEQRHAELLLHLLDRLRKGRLREPQHLRGTRQAAVVCDRQEMAKVMDVHKRSL